MNKSFGWGQGIWLVYGFFAAGILLLVYLSTKQSIDLVDEQYYQQELAFQGRLDAQNRANSRGMLLELKGDSLRIKGVGATYGSVYAYCPTQSQNDRRWVLDLKASRVWSLPLSTLMPAAYRLDVEWVEAGDTFFQSIDYRAKQ
jgi:hypothetical protein